MTNPVLSPEEYESFKEHCVRCWPEEACGVLVSDVFIPCRNVSDNPTVSFVLNKYDYIKASLQGPIQAILHSHPIDRMKVQEFPPEWPSVHDQKKWMSGSIPWGIVACEGENITDQHRMVWMNEDYIPPLLGREYVWAVTDCYSIVRDWYNLEMGIKLPNFARNWDWWNNGEDLFMQNLLDVGFVEISRSEAKVGDGLLFKLRSNVINHCAVITGTNQILHHGAKILSSHDELVRHANKASLVVRYKGK